MKCCITIKRSEQDGPSSWANWTDVIHFNENETLKEIVKKHKGALQFFLRKAHVELHIELSQEEDLSTGLEE